jgi:hypothetical protein
LSAQRKGDERPQAPWGSFPLAELTILAGVVMLVVGIVGGNRTPLVIGLALGALGGLEVAVREHLAGYRSHTTLLAGTVFVIAVGGLRFLAGLAVPLSVALGALAFALALVVLRRAFQRASGGLSFRIGRLRG